MNYPSERPCFAGSRVDRGAWRGAWVLALVAAGTAWPNTLTVTNVNDSGAGSLRAAITSAANGDSIDFNLSYPATIVLSSTITIATSLTITGPGAPNLLINGSTTAEVFLVSAPATISGVALGSGATSCCGALIWNSSTLIMDNCALAGNSTGSAGGVANYSSLTLNNTIVSGFTVSGITNTYGSVTLNSSTVSGNIYRGNNGGGILLYGGSLVLNNSTISGNSADYGGGIYNSNGTVMVTNSTIAQNSAAWAGGGVDNAGGTLALTFSTVAFNSAIGNGGGIYSSGTVKLKNSLLAGNGTAGNCFSFPMVSYGHNLSDDASCSMSGPGDLMGTAAGLDPLGLADHGGPTRTIALLPDSAALDAVPDGGACAAQDGVTAVTTDQRGTARPQGAGCDIGAFELFTDTFTVTTVPAGLSVTVDGISYTAPQTFNWAEGTTHAIAVNAVESNSSSSYQFQNWSDGGALSHVVTASSGQPSYAATFLVLTPVTISTVPGFVQFTVDGTAYSTAQTFQWAPGSAHAIAAATTFLFNNTDYGFVNWSDGTTVAAETIATPSSAASYTATYAALTYVTIATAPPGLTFTADGTSYVAPQVFYWWPNSTHSLGTAARQGLGGASYTFAAWSNEGPVSQQVVVPASSAGYTAAFTIVNPAAVVSLTGPPAPVAGQAATFSVQVASSTLGGTPTGSVQLSDAASKLGTVTLAQGQATFAVALLTAGPHLMTASYSGDANYAASVANLIVTVNPVAATVSLVPDASIAAFGQTITLTSQIGPQESFAVPNGQVQIIEGTTVLGTVAPTSGLATLQVSRLAVGVHTLIAQYAGDTTWSATVSGPLVLTVNPAATSVSITPAALALSVTVSASGSGSGTPTGTVQFVDAATKAVLTSETLAPGAGGAGVASTSLSAVAGHSVEAVYAGDGNFSAGSSAALVVPALVNAAGGSSLAFAPSELVTLFGAGFATATTQSSDGTATSLGGRTITVIDSAGVTRSAALYLVSAQQINFLMPEATAAGAATIMLNGAGTTIAPVPATVSTIAPGLFSSAAQIVRVGSDGSQTVESGSGPISMASDTLYLVLYGTGIRNRSSLANVRCVIGQQSFPVLYAGPQSQTPGLDQVNVLLLPSLQGAGVVTAAIVVDGMSTNSVTLQFQ